MTLRELAAAINQMPESEKDQEIMYASDHNLITFNEDDGDPEFNKDKSSLDDPDLTEISAFTRVYDSDSDCYAWVLHN